MVLLFKQVSIAYALHAIMVTLLNRVSVQNRPVIDQFYRRFVYLHLVKRDEGVDPWIDNDSLSLTNHEDILDYQGLASNALHINRIFTARHECVIFEQKVIILCQIGYHTSRPEVVEVTVLDAQVSSEVVDCGSGWFGVATSSEGAVANETRGPLRLINASRSAQLIAFDRKVAPL